VDRIIRVRIPLAGCRCVTVLAICVFWTLCPPSTQQQE